MKKLPCIQEVPIGDLSLLFPPHIRSPLIFQRQWSSISTSNGNGNAKAKFEKQSAKNALIMAGIENGEAALWADETTLKIARRYQDVLGIAHLREQDPKVGRAAVFSIGEQATSPLSSSSYAGR